MLKDKMKNNNWQARFKNEKKHFHSSPIPVLTFIKLHKKSHWTSFIFCHNIYYFLKYRIISTTYQHTTLKTICHLTGSEGTAFKTWYNTHKSYKLFISSWWSQKHIHHIWYTKTSFLPWKITLSKQANQSYLVNVINLCATVWIAQ